MKVLKNILRWFLCVFLAYSVIFTLTKYVDIAEGIMILNNKEETYNEIFNEDNIKSSDETMKFYFLENGKENEQLSNLYNKYPAGAVYMMSFYSRGVSNGETALITSVLALIMGTAVFLLINSKEKQEIKLAIVFYLISVIILGFIQGMQNMIGDGKNILSYWTFPNEYIVPITIAFGLVILVRVVKQKDLARKLNEKLKEKHTEK